MRILIASVMLSCAAFAGAPLSEPYTREVKVPAAGWYRVPVDGHIWRYAQGRVLAFDENGKMLPCGILPVKITPLDAEEAQPRMVKVEEIGDNLVLYLQVDNLVGKHDRLTLDFSSSDALPFVTLWGSEDGKAWAPMAQGSLFHLGPEERLQGASLSYPLSGFDHLKLALPKGDGNLQRAIRDLRVTNFHLHYADDEIISEWLDEPVAVRPADVSLTKALVGSDEALMQLDLPAGGYSAQSIVFKMNSPHMPLPISLIKMEQGMPFQEYSCTLGTDADSVPLPRNYLWTPALIKIPRERASIGSVIVRRPREEVVFFSELAGPLTLAYGGAEERTWPSPQTHKTSDIQEAEMGAVTERASIVSPEMKHALSMGSGQIIATSVQWSLILPKDAVSGQWVMVELTPKVIEPGLGNDTSIDHGVAFGIMTSNGKLVPAYWRVSPMPVNIWTGHVDLKTDPAFPMQASGEFVLNDRDAPLHWMSISTRHQIEPVNATVEVPLSPEESARLPNKPSTHPWQPVGSAKLECDPWTTDCSTIIKCGGSRSERLLITVEGHTAYPPTSMEVSIWSYHSWLVFPVPEERDVRLFLGTIKGNMEPVGGLYISKARLPFDLPEAKSGGFVERSAQQFPWDRILFIAGLILAVGVLLYLIVKLLPRRQEG